MRRRALLIHDEWTEAEIQSPYLVMEALEDGFNFSLSANTLQYRLMEDGEWVSLPAGTQLPMTLAKGRKVWLKGSNMTIAEENGIGTFSTTGKFNLSGNCFALLYGDNMDFGAAAPDYCFKNLFKGTSVVNVSSGFLPLKTMGKFCFDSMFQNCTSLESFVSLPASTLARGCYYYMFSQCSNLVLAPKLPATKMADDCYMAMFWYCSNLETAPDLLATTLGLNSYNSMFRGCSKLSYVKCLATTYIDYGAQSWLSEVAATGTLVKAAGSTLTAPEGWTVIEI